MHARLSQTVTACFQAAIRDSNAQTRLGHVTPPDKTAGNTTRHATLCPWLDLTTCRVLIKTAELSCATLCKW